MRRLTALALALTAPLGAQNGAEGHPAAEPSRLFRGWLEEILHHDPAKARQDYLATVDNPEAPPAYKAIARARLAELARLHGDEEEARGHLAELRELIRLPRRGFDPELRLPRSGLAAALAEPPGPERDRALAELREEIGRLRSGPRRLVGFVQQQLQEEETAALQDLFRKLAAARQAGDQERAAQLRQQLRRLSPYYARTGEQLRERNRRLLVLITRTHLQGRHSEAEQYQRLLGGRFRRPSIPADADRAQLLSGVQENLARIVAESTSREEREALGQLAERLRSLAASGQVEEAVSLAARVPYRLLPR